MDQFYITQPNFHKNSTSNVIKRQSFLNFAPLSIALSASINVHLTMKIYGVQTEPLSQWIILKVRANTILALNHQFVKTGSNILCDENPVYNVLDFHYTRWTVNHQGCFNAKEVSNNLAESFNARFRDLHRSVHHKCDNKYALHYANQAAYMSDNRRKLNGALVNDILKRCLWVLPLREWVGYWQGNHRTTELLGMTAFSSEEISLSYFKNLNEMMKYEQELLAA